MRRYVPLALLGFSLAALPSTAMAADQNAYRAGSPYLKTAASNFSQCAQQCQGDAACRGWNFIRPNPRAASGICEFNARAANPMASPISISGSVSSSVDPMMSRAVSAGTNTIRVGTPTAPVAKPTVQRRRQRIVKRQPVPTQQRNVRPTAHTRPAPQTPSLRTPRTYGAAPKPSAPQAAPQPQKQQNPQTEQEYYRQQYLAHKRQQDQMRAAQIKAQQQAALQRRPAQMQRPAPRAPQATNIPPQQMNAPRPPMPAQRAPRAPQVPATGINVPPQSLYGSLHDDLTKNMTAVPRPRTAPDNMANPDAPVSTSRAVPTKPVQTAPLKKNALPALAGG